MTNLEVGDVVLCTVDRIVGTIVFVKIEGDGEGSIILSEIAPGRIRNLRDYVVPKKKIICKILRITGDRIHLSLRRVTPKEQKQIREEYKLEKSAKSIIKSIIGEKSKDVINQISRDQKLHEFLQDAKVDSKKLEKLVGKEATEKILDILNSQKNKISSVKKEIFLSSQEPNGLTLIKELLSQIKDVEIKYISGGLYSFKVSDEDIKSADNKLKEILNEIDEKAKAQKIEFHIKEK